jgi:hypothetical protein
VSIQRVYSQYELLTLIIDIRLDVVAKFVIIFGTKQSWHVYNIGLCDNIYAIFYSYDESSSYALPSLYVSITPSALHQRQLKQSNLDD